MTVFFLALVQIQRLGVVKYTQRYTNTHFCVPRAAATEGAALGGLAGVGAE